LEHVNLRSKEGGQEGGEEGEEEVEEEGGEEGRDAGAEAAAGAEGKEMVVEEGPLEPPKSGRAKGEDKPATVQARRKVLNQQRRAAQRNAVSTLSPGAHRDLQEPRAGQAAPRAWPTVGREQVQVIC
jgi:hypothetical protein